jgi:hypothetical protein
MPIDTNDLGGVNLEGKEFEFEDEFHGTGHKVRVRVVRNSGTANIKPKRTTKFDANAYGRRVTAVQDAAAGYGFPADERLPAAGVVPNDLFYVVVGGPALVLSPDAGCTITAGDHIASTGTDGRVDKVDDTPVAEVVNKVGRAMAAATGAVATDILVGVGW